MAKTVCECGLAKCYHEGSHDIATKPTYQERLIFRIGPFAVYRETEYPPVCTGYTPRQ